MTDTDRQDEEGLPLEVRIQTTRYALFRLLRANAPHSRLREEWSKLETLLDTPQPIRDAAEGAPCPVAGCGEVVGDTKDPRWDQGQCPKCEKYFWKSATPQPAPVPSPDGAGEPDR